MSIILFKPLTDDIRLVKPEPKYKVYERAIQRFAEGHKGISELDHNDIKKLVLLEVKYIYAIHRSDVNKDDVAYYRMNPMDRFSCLDAIVNLIGLLKPMELSELFPICKIYDGDRYKTKDYYYTMEALNKLDPEQPIGQETFALLWDYQNWSVNFFMVELVSAMNIVGQYHGKQDFFDNLFTDNRKAEVRSVNRFMILPGGLK